jgi:RimJ/RimL family protein N-acetyltransferase
MELKVLTKEELEQVRQWRNRNLEIWRTPFLLTKEMQENFYDSVINNRNATSRYWGVHLELSEITDSQFIGMVGLTDISLENRIAELSMQLNVDVGKQGHGTQALIKLLDKGFDELNLENIYGEAYTCSPIIDFWYKTLKKFDIEYVFLRARKYWNGEYHSSIYFNFSKEDFKNMRGK